VVHLEFKVTWSKSELLTILSVRDFRRSPAQIIPAKVTDISTSKGRGRGQGKARTAAARELFDQPAALIIDLEIGCGVGLHPISRAKEFPDRHLIAIEHTSEKFNKFASRMARHPELKNILPVHADAVQFVSSFVPDARLDHVFLLFPNPEPKASNKRWMRSPFMHELLRKLKPTGTLQLATNIESYFREALLYGEEFWNLEVISQQNYKLASLPFPRPRTHFEKKYLERGEFCFDVVFKNNPDRAQEAESKKLSTRTER